MPGLSTQDNILHPKRSKLWKLCDKSIIFPLAPMSHFQVCQHVPQHLCMLPNQRTARAITIGAVLRTPASCSCCSLLEIAHRWRHSFDFVPGELWLPLLGANPNCPQGSASCPGCQPQAGTSATTQGIMGDLQQPSLWSRLK